jgi:hypothetical protein
MAAFDFIESSAKGYRFLALNREAVLRLAAVPLILKLASFLGVAVLDMDDNFLRQGLLLLPSYFAEGWLIAQLIRMAVFNESWPIAITGNKTQDLALVNTRGRPILAAAVMYLLVKLALSVFSGLMMSAGAAQPAPPPAAADSSIMVLIAAAVGVAFLVWLFRFLWLYIPMALGLPLADFLIRIKAFMTSVYMLGTWLLCFVPPALMLVVAAWFFGYVFPVGADGEPTEAYTYIMVAVQAVLEMVISMVSSVAMAFGLYSIYQGTNRGNFY